MTKSPSKILALTAAIAMGATAALAMDNEREVVGSMVAMDTEMVGLFEMIDKDKDGSVSAAELEAHQAMVNKMVMMALDNKHR